MLLQEKIDFTLKNIFFLENWTKLTISHKLLDELNLPT